MKVKRKETHVLKPAAAINLRFSTGYSTDRPFADYCHDVWIQFYCFLFYFVSFIPMCHGVLLPVFVLFSLPCDCPI